MVGFPKIQKKTEEEKKKIKIDKRKKLQNKWQSNNKINKSKSHRKRRKKFSKSWYNKQLDILFSKYIRLRDGRCQKCGVLVGLQCSHVIPKSQSLFLRWNVENAKALCTACHIYWWHKDVLAAQKWFAKKFPNRVKYLEQYRNTIANFTLEDYEKMFNDLTDKIKGLENEK